MINVMELFAGVGSLSSQWLKGWRTVCYVERAKYPAAIIEARIRDGLLDDAPIWDDVGTFDGRPWRGFVDVIKAGFPCQPFSLSGKQLGGADTRNGWPDTVRIIGEVRPQIAFLENSSNLLSVSRKWGRGSYFNTILGDLAGIGYDAVWGCLSASTIGGSHKRRRVWIVAYPNGERRQVVLRCKQGHQPKATKGVEARIKQEATPLDAIFSNLSRLEKRLGQPSVFGTNDGTPHRVDRLTAIGNGEVPAVAQAAWDLLTND